MTFTVFQSAAKSSRKTGFSHATQTSDLINAFKQIWLEHERASGLHRYVHQVSRYFIFKRFKRVGMKSRAERQVDLLNTLESSLVAILHTQLNNKRSHSLRSETIEFNAGNNNQPKAKTFFMAI